MKAAYLYSSTVVEFRANVAGGRIKPIVTGGSYMNLMRRWKLAVYYDQEGALAKKLGIHAVPALVFQEGKRLRIDELPHS